MACEASKVNRKKSRCFRNNRLFPAAVLSLVSCFLLLFYAPLEIYCNNYGEFWFSFVLLLKLMLPVFLIAFLALTAVSALILRINTKAYTVYLVLFATIFLSVYIQGTFFVGKLPALDGNPVDWSLYSGQYVVSFAVILLCLAVVLLSLHFLRQSKWERALCWLGGGMTLMLTLTLATLCLTTGAYKTRTYELTTDDLMELSEDENYIILMVDAVDTEVFSRLLAEHPEYETGVLKDFIRYSNVLSGYHITQYSIPMFLSGKWYERTEPYEEYFSSAFRDSVFLRELQRQAYTLDFYTDTVPYDFYPALSNVYESAQVLTNPVGLLKKELRLVGFRYAPFILKPYFRFDALDFDSLRSRDHLPYIPTTANIDFDEAMSTRPILFSEGKRFKFIHLDGAHNGSFNQKLEDGEIVLEEGFSSASDKTEVCMFLLQKFTALLKEQGIYDSSVIVMMSDHGQQPLEDTLDGDAWMLRRADPVFLVKGFGEQHNKMIEDSRPISYIELSEAFLQLLGGSSGADLFAPRPGDFVRRYFTTDTYNWDILHEYEQSGSPSDISSFTATGMVFS